ncbi:hypothetical protein [Flavivirga jejuensis]|uniref:ATPase family protein associated with various cellular activities (AAA) n=1 Tax=Flavivirga jejuensis TaxID=870487 RepID=A0ABT8WUQ2_9FLAO|nr:hypothetical protein [Flavivirga jejuensis]MDO5976922.1 hypothetical protein [Flavivirga jejuensis]
MDKNAMLLNITSLTVEQLFEEIKTGKVTLDELKNTGQLDAQKRRDIQELLNDLERIDNEAWEKAKYSDELALRDYITRFPNGKHVQEAKNSIKFLEEERGRTHAQKRVILDKLKTNLNEYAPDQILDYLRNGILNHNDLLDLGISTKVLDALTSTKQSSLKLGKTPQSIPDGYTEVYFWGIPGSGKTCALGALLSTAHKAGYLEYAMGPGYDYMTQLKNIFVDDIAILPPPSPTDSTQYLPFTLKTSKENNARSVSLIELSGEIFQCFYNKNAGQELPSQSHQETFDSLMRFLRGNNRKIHFFFIDFDKKNKRDADGYLQSDYLEAASSFFNKPENKVFGKSTDAIFLVVTKADLIPGEDKERIDKAKEYLNEGFLALINTLKGICKKNRINGGELTVEPFSLGKVYFQQLCEFDNTSAQEIIKTFMKRIRPSKKSILDLFNK